MIRGIIEQIQNYVLWHYQYGSKYDTKFWDYAQSLEWEDDHMQTYIDYARKYDLQYTNTRILWWNDKTCFICTVGAIVSSVG